MEALKYILFSIGVFLKKYLLIAFLAICAYLSPIADTLWFVGGLVTCDFITGVIKAHKTKTMDSNRMIDKFYVSVGYLIGILIIRSIEIYLNLSDTVPLVKGAVAVIAAAELQSMRENIKAITGIDLLTDTGKILKNKSKR